MKHTKKLLYLALFILVINACSTKKDTFVNRNYHVLTTKYNVLFNGKESFKLGLKDLRAQQKDDWFKQLEIEPIAFDEDKLIVPNYSPQPVSDKPIMDLDFGFLGSKDKPIEVKQEEKQRTEFERAEEKAVKAIQKHGMNIDGLERNRQIDDAYLLLGKSRYYSQRFIPAIEAFNYVIANYPNASLIAETKIWRAKANIRIDNEKFAIESMKLLLVVKDTLEADLPDLIKEQANTALAMAYVRADSVQNVIKHLTLATRTQEDKEQAARNMFILGQIYAAQNKKDSAAVVFNKLSNLKRIPYKYKIRAVVELAKNTTVDSVSNSVLKRLQDLIKERENRPYLDALYYQVGVIYQNKDSIALAKTFYNKSLAQDAASDKQKSYAFERLGNLYYKNSNYTVANSYFDSVLQVSQNDTLDLRIRRVKRKFKGLEKLIAFENTIKTNDSVVKIAALPKAAQVAFFTSYIDSLKQKDEAAAQLRLNQLAFANNTSSLQSTQKGAWYFYNGEAINFGKNEFKKRWGDRQLTDNWRFLSEVIKNNAKTDSTAVVQQQDKYSLDTYLKAIPKTQGAIDTLKLERNNALYQVGLIYKEKFKDTVLAVNRLERALSLKPQKELILPLNWHLYQLYNNSGNLNKALVYKNTIVTNYANTVFAQMIQNPNKTPEAQEATNALEDNYKALYYMYKDKKYKDVISAVNAKLPELNNAKIKPKYELLKAYAIGKIMSKDDYKAALDYISINYANTEEGKKAKEILTQLKKD